MAPANSISNCILEQPLIRNNEMPPIRNDEDGERLVRSITQGFISSGSPGCNSILDPLGSARSHV